MNERMLCYGQKRRVPSGQVYSTEGPAQETHPEKHSIWIDLSKARGESGSVPPAQEANQMIRDLQSHPKLRKTLEGKETNHLVSSLMMM